MKTELDLFSVPETQFSIQHGIWVEYNPVATITDNGPIEFSISGSGNLLYCYYDLEVTIIVWEQNKYISLLSFFR